MYIYRYHNYRYPLVQACRAHNDPGGAIHSVASSYQVGKPVVTYKTRVSLYNGSGTYRQLNHGMVDETGDDSIISGFAWLDNYG